MEFPIFHLDGTGNRLLIAVVAILHVLINHALAVGAFPLIVWFEYLGIRNADPRWDRQARRLLKVCFIVTTTVGALSGVGIWFSVALVNPAAIASLIRVFFWAWFLEWLVFITEVGLILAYFLTWDRLRGEQKRLHLRIGVALAIFSWITMAIITAILGFMMDPGAWLEGRSFFAAVFNPLYFPQLAFRTLVSFVSGGLFVWFLLLWDRDPDRDFRGRVVRTTAAWVLGWAPFLVWAGSLYQARIPAAMQANVPTALMTQQYAEWSHRMVQFNIFLVCGTMVIALGGMIRPRHIPRIALALPFGALLFLLAEFERVREFIRKPYVIAGYMYANGLRTVDVPLFRRDGLLNHATYVSVREVNPFNRLEAGREVFRLACTRCHTTSGINGIVGQLNAMFANRTPDREAIEALLDGLHGSRPYMPPFPGNPAERRALAEYLIDLRTNPKPLDGAQAGIAAASLPAPPERASALATGLTEGAIGPSQEAFAALADQGDPYADAVLDHWFGRLEQERVPPALRLDLLEAAALRPGLKPRASACLAARATAPLAERFGHLLEGGDATRGREWFVQKACVSCHRLDGRGGNVGPDLTALAGKRTRAEWLESIVDPNARISEGFKSVSAVTIEGTVVTGILRSETADALELLLANGQTVRIPADEIEERLPGPSMMPTGFGTSLQPAELRDLVELLARPPAVSPAPSRD